RARLLKEAASVRHGWRPGRMVYIGAMMKVLQGAIEKIKKLPEDRLASAALVLEQIATSGGEVFAGAGLASCGGAGRPWAAERGVFARRRDAVLWKKCGL